MGMLVSTTETKTRTISQETGEVFKEVIESTQTPRPESEPPYIKLYLADIMKLKNIPKGMNSVLYWLLQNCAPYFDQAKGRFSLNAGMKRIMSKDLDLSISSINNALYRFVAEELLYRIDVGVFQFNPYLFGRGSWKNIKDIRLEIDYAKEGRTMRAKIKQYEPLEEE